MRIEDLLQVMREEFALAAVEVDGELMAWLADDPAEAQTHAEPVAALFDRLAQTSRMIALEGQASVLDLLRDAAGLLAMTDEDTMGQGLGWLSGWRMALEPCFEQPGDAAANQVLLDYLRAGPMAPTPEADADLRRQLEQPAALPGGAEAADEVLPAATDDDVSLQVPDDVDHGLLETLLTEAPEQLARLGDCARALARGGLPAGQLIEAQRVAHTFKGSGNIIGIRGVARLAHRIEDLFEFALEQGGTLPAAMGHDLEMAVAALDQMVSALRGEEAPPADALARLQGLLDWINAIHDGSWADLCAAAAPAAMPMPADAAPAAAILPPSPSPALAPSSAENGRSEAQLRVGVSALDRLVRRAGQGLVQSGRLGEQLRVVEDRLSALESNNQLLQARLRELESALERQGVNLHERAQEEGGTFDALEMDRYNDLHALSRFVSELVADELELARGASAEAREARATWREQGLALKEQHRELLGTRLVPFRLIGPRLRRNVSQTAAATGKQVRLEIEGELVQLDSDVLDRLTEPLLHLLRNAVDHGIEPAQERLLHGKPEEGVVRLCCSRDGQTVRIDCRDDGRGLDLAAIQAKAVGLGLLADDAPPDAQALMRLILLPGFTTRDAVTEVSGRGVGMDVVADRVRAMKGQVEIDSRPLDGTTFTVRVPATTGSTHALVVQSAGDQVAVPTESVVMALAAGQGEHADQRFRYAGFDVRQVSLAAWLGQAPAAELPPASRPVVLARVRAEVVALSVDAVLDAREVILQDMGRLLRRLPGVGGGALRPDGKVLFVLDMDRLGLDAAGSAARAALAQMRRRTLVKRKRVLVVDDALSVRKALAQLLGDAGYQVQTSRDGFEALDALQRETPDILLTDLEMPNLNGLDLTRQVRQQAALSQLPVLMITSRSSDKHRARAEEAGVTRYLTKPCTDAVLLEQVRELLAV